MSFQIALITPIGKTPEQPILSPDPDYIALIMNPNQDHYEDGEAEMVKMRLRDVPVGGGEPDEHHVELVAILHPNGQQADHSICLTEEDLESALHELRRRKTAEVQVTETLDDQPGDVGSVRPRPVVDAPQA